MVAGHRLSRAVWKVLLFNLALVSFSFESAAQGVMIVSVSGGAAHSLALDSAGGVWAWGANNLRQLGDGTRINRTTPVRVADPTGFLTGVVAVSASGMSLALKADGSVRAWGPNSFAN
jgi:alpha-tubulin suppressor-like RCC1 family protein